MDHPTPRQSTTGPEPQSVTYIPREPTEVATAYGPSTFDVGPGFDQVIVRLSPVAADELARVVAASRRLEPTTDGNGPESDVRWYRLVVDLLAAAALADPSAFRTPPRAVPLRGIAL